MTITTIEPEVPRDTWGRPKVIPPQGGKPVSYTRCTTYVGGIEDTFKLGQWQQRHVAVGLAMRPDLLSAVGSSDLEDKAGLNRLCDEAKEAAGASDSAKWGTYMHKVTEAADRGEDPGAVALPELAYPRDAMAYMPDLAAYLDATSPLRRLHIEAFSVLDTLKIGGTSDRIVEVRGKRYIADLKTGSIEYGSLKIAAQLAVYARSHLYDWRRAAELGSSATPEQAKALRTAPGVEVDKGIVVHLPAGEGVCTLYWVDLLAGWDAVRTCRSIREKRTAKFRDLMQAFTPRVSTGQATIDLATRVTQATTAQAVRDLWRDHAPEWSDDLTALAKRHIASLPQ